MAAFARLALRPEVDPGRPPGAAPNPEMAKRPRGVIVFTKAMQVCPLTLAELASHADL